MHELETYRLIDEQRLQEVRVELNDPDYSVDQRVREVGATHLYLPIVSYILMALFAVVGLLACLANPSPNAPETSDA